MQSEAETLILLGDIPVSQYLKNVAEVPYSTLGEYVDMYGYGNSTEVTNGEKSKGASSCSYGTELWVHSEKWKSMHKSGSVSAVLTISKIF